jgi:hypothetical protein
LDAAHTLANLSFCKLRATMVESGLVETMTWLTLEDCLQVTLPTYKNWTMPVLLQLTTGRRQVVRGLKGTCRRLSVCDMRQYNTPIFQRVSVAMRNVMLVPEGVRSKTIMEDKLLDVIFKVSQVRAPTTKGKCHGAQHLQVWALMNRERHYDKDLCGLLCVWCSTRRMRCS